MSTRSMRATVAPTLFSTPSIGSSLLLGMDATQSCALAILLCTRKAMQGPLVALAVLPCSSVQMLPWHSNRDYVGHTCNTPTTSTSQISPQNTRSWTGISRSTATRKPLTLATKPTTPESHLCKRPQPTATSTATAPIPSRKTPTPPSTASIT